MEEKKSKKTIRIFALASFLNDFGSDMIYPIWPLFVVNILGANMAILGFIDGLGDAIVSISQAISGYMSDRMRKRKVFVWIGYLFASLSRIGYSVTSVWQQLIPFRILDRAGKMRGAPRDAIIADESTHMNRGRNFGFLRAMDNFGAVCGIVVGIFLLNFLGYRRLFMIASIPSLIGALLIVLLIKEKQPKEKRLYAGIKLKNLNNNFKLFLLLSSIFALGSFSYSFLLIYANVAGIKTLFVPILYLVFTAVTFIFSYPFGRLADNVGRKPIILFSFILWVFVCALLIFFRSVLSIIIAFILYGIHRGALEPVQKTFVSELAPREYRASALGGFQMVTGIVALPASLFAGLLWEHVGVVVPFYFSLGLSLCAIFLLLFVQENRDSII
ncbi:MAG: MFS transporter [bacterium]